MIPVSGLVTRRCGLSDRLMEVYTIFVDSRQTHTDVSEDEFFDIMEEYALSFYETGTPHPDSVTHIIKDLDG